MAIPNTRHRTLNLATKKPAPEHPSAGAGVGVYSDKGECIGPVFSSVEKAPKATDSERHFSAGRLSTVHDLHSEFVELFKEAERWIKNDVTGQ